MRSGTGLTETPEHSSAQTTSLQRGTPSAPTPQSSLRRLQTFCTLNALAVKAPEGAPRSFALSQANPVNVVYGLLNPLPGQIGTFGNRTIDSWGQFFLDANIQKSFQISESKALSIRVDATNILNHPQLATPNFAVNNTAFGNIASKGGAIAGGAPVQRNFQAQVRLTF